MPVSGGKRLKPSPCIIAFTSLRVGLLEKRELVLGCALIKFDKRLLVWLNLG
jgi:hypothetical protein